MIVGSTSFHGSSRNMPVISVTLLPGYSSEAEQRLVGRVALAARSVVAAAAAGTTVFVNHAATYQRDGKVFSAGGAELPEASRQVRAFLDCMEQRDLEGAKRLLGSGFEMHFPAAAPMQQLEDLVAHARGRYRHASKTYTRFDESWDDACTVVYCFGTLQGVWLDGTPFTGIRFIDRFELVQGLIRRQDVWNDLALHLPAATMHD
jgi:phenylpyruvate tautomerase PptA (4-oxalocrotonate tautomerase family)